MPDGRITQVRRGARPASHPVEARYRLFGTVLPRVTDTVSVAERVRQLLMGIHRKLEGGVPSRVSALFAGKDADGNPAQGHAHAYFLPVDEDGDGRIDHLVVRASHGFAPTEQQALDRLQRFWQSDGKPHVHMALTALLSAVPEVERRRRFRSVTPFIPPRHHRKGRGSFDSWLVEELGREFENHGLPRPSAVERIDQTLHAPPLRWFQFMRSRKKDRRRAKSGYGFVVELPDVVAGPFAVGYGAHFGLGLFVAEDCSAPPQQ